MVKKVSVFEFWFIFSHDYQLCFLSFYISLHRIHIWMLRVSSSRISQDSYALFLAQCGWRSRTKNKNNKHTNQKKEIEFSWNSWNPIISIIIRVAQLYSFKLKLLSYILCAIGIFIMLFNKTIEGCRMLFISFVYFC